MELSEWMVLYVKHKDAYTRKLQEIEEGNPTIFHYTDKDVHGYPLEELTLPDVKSPTLICTLQTDENVNHLIENWDAFVAQEDLTIVFVNPAKNAKWLIKPKMHARIHGDDLELGIRAMAENVPVV